ncbi:UDP-3-O-acyl-N-acetylglucosamine deacetylase [Natroniella sulfidigena]|uniref:UDP-3-O-acyl-N-acetylglucosamine deacetylase n=1 Tax=Natroniella sulfidigena TaxID=723921 RepID=UPI00200ACE74|nr:UDP-3-O-acyl-N-acetylglucosamine deacetylase [Natroniella sulfidigena]MCK8816359.1 UDP-3-O-acyl-N-acetylglucosamine deacetylase [Natroniella sulfidigena]
MVRKQRTIKKKFSYTGVGLHTGEDVTITCKPLAVNQGIKFKRVDLPDQPELEATVENVYSTNRCTTLGTAKWQINTVEHLLAALNALRIDNLLIEIDANEPPITDGSAKVFYNLLQEAGIEKQKEEVTVYQFDQPLYVTEGKHYLTILPCDQFKVSYTFVSKHQGLTDQFAELVISEEEFKKQISSARTFGFADEIEKLQQAGLALGGSLDNAILIADDGPVNQLRFSNEIARHKILDIVGDMKLAPEFRGHIIAVRSGHKLNFKLAKRIKRLITEEALLC